MTLVEALKHQTSIWVSFAVTSTLFAGFLIWVPNVGGQILDSVADPTEIAFLLDNMNVAQRRSHFWMTLALDMPFPIAYGIFFIGVIWKFFGRRGLWIALPAYACVCTDLAENTVQLMVLSGHDDLIVHKAYLTPLKRLLFLGSIAAASSALITGVIRRLSPSGAETETDAPS